MPSAKSPNDPVFSCEEACWRHSTPLGHAPTAAAGMDLGG